MALTYDSLARLVPEHQKHLLAFWDRLDAKQRQSLAEEIRRIDFALIDRLYHQPDRKGEIQALVDRAEEPPAFRLGSRANRYAPEEAIRRGQEALGSGEVGALLVAGGQGTRLGFDEPKGVFPIGPISQHSLFQIHIEKLLATSRRYGRSMALYVMTSPATYQATVDFLARHDRFGLPEADLRVFCQGTMPAVDVQTGKILLERPDHIALSPDGHGGMLAALAGSGLLDELHQRAVKHLFYFQVDNPLVQVCNAEFLGYHLLSGAEMTTQVVAKQTPEDRVGNVVRVGDRLHVIEYSDLPQEVAERRKADGSLAIWAGSIAVHAMDVAFLTRMAQRAESLPFHVARKKVPFIDAQGRRIEPQKPNAIKFERFIFDLMPWAVRAIVVEVDAAEHFAPLKNAPGAATDTPEWVRAQMVALHTRWLRQVGVEVREGVAVEISPLFALDPAELSGKLSPGTRITTPTYFSPDSLPNNH